MTTRRPIVAGNWKMNKSHLDAMRLVQQLGHELADHDYERVEVVLCPPFTSLRTIQTLIDSDRYRFHLGAQNMHHAPAGAFTGEISAPMLTALKVSYVILGHSERRELLHESDEDVNAKVKGALANDLSPIMCCGETETERDSGQTESKVEAQIRSGLAGVKPDPASRVVIAYEPIWAIGTGATATPDDAQRTISFIRQVLSDELGDELAARKQILYGGSVKSGNIASITSQPDIDGALVGGASLDATEFAAVVKAAKA
jgi:triosephosphate isomerase